jgi:uncharacterized protein YukE
MKVGFIDLAENAFKIEKQIEHALRDRWLDGDTAHEFKNEMYKRRKQKGGLKALLKEINTEIEFRKKTFGGMDETIKQKANRVNTAV